MKRIIWPLILLALSVQAHADLYRVIGIKCNQQTDRLIVYYYEPPEDKIDYVQTHKTSNEWDATDLIGPEEIPGYYGELRYVSRTCALTHGRYTVWIGPDPDNMNYNGECGAVVSFWVEIKRDDAWVLTRHRLDSERCHQRNSVTTSRIVVDASSPKPKFTVLPRSAP